MKKLYCCLLSLLMVLSLSSCGAEVSRDVYNTLSNRYSELQTQYDELNTSYNDLQKNFNELTANDDTLQQEYNTLQQEFNTLQSEYDSYKNKMKPYEIDQFVNQVSENISDSIGIEDSIDNISFENGDLRIYVTLGNPAPLTYEDLMISRTSSITDKILTFEEWYELWETITIDFGKHGYIQNGHENIGSNSYGSYFMQEKYIIKFTP